MIGLIIAAGALIYLGVVADGGSRKRRFIGLVVILMAAYVLQLAVERVKEGNDAARWAVIVLFLLICVLISWIERGAPE